MIIILYWVYFYFQFLASLTILVVGINMWQHLVMVTAWASFFKMDLSISLEALYSLQY